MSEVSSKQVALLFFFVLQWMINYSRGNQCSAAFTIVAKGHRLKDCHITEVKGHSILECAQFCLKKYPYCQSINYEADHNSTHLPKCQLNNSTKRLKPLNLVEDGAFDYLEPVQRTVRKELDTLKPQSNEKFFARFTNLGATGRFGPTTLATFYVGKDHEHTVSLVNGIQHWTVPYTGTYQILAVGAAGGYDTSGSSTRGRGASIKGHFDLTEGDVVKILVGQEGKVNVMTSSGGGGGTFVVTSDNVPLVVAGGGGGTESLTSRLDNCDANTGTSGKANGCSACAGWSGGTNGGGGVQADYSNSGGGGGGFNGDGRSSSEFGGEYGTGGEGGKSFLNGGAGGRSKINDAVGGFGGGGGAYGHGGGAGGGGGYSGGASGDNVVGSCGGGGGSYNSGQNQENVGGYNTNDHGFVEISRVFI